MPVQLRTTMINPSLLGQADHKNIAATVAPVWQEWGQWSQCLPSCGQGSKVRTRTCSVPAVEGVAQCPGNPTQDKYCSSDYCSGELRTTTFKGLKSMNEYSFGPNGECNDQK